ncbi:MAG: type II secretion system protein [bacterium]|nr:type II secretion system protein [bacterium]
MILKNNKGFTLIEILVVVAIVGLLSSVVLVGLGGVRAKGRDAKRLAEIRQVQNALELYYSKCGFYPGGDDCAVASPASWSVLSTTLTTGTSLGITKIPNDPSYSSSDTDSPTYYYAVSPTRDSYVIGATLEDLNNPALNSDEEDSTLPASGPSAWSLWTKADLTSCNDPVYCVRF